MNFYDFNHPGWAASCGGYTWWTCASRSFGTSHPWSSGGLSWEILRNKNCYFWFRRYESSCGHFVSVVFCGPFFWKKMMWTHLINIRSGRFFILLLARFRNGEVGLIGYAAVLSSLASVFGVGATNGCYISKRLLKCTSNIHLEWFRIARYMLL